MYCAFFPHSFPGQDPVPFLGFLTAQLHYEEVSVKEMEFVKPPTGDFYAENHLL